MPTLQAKLASCLRAVLLLLYCLWAGTAWAASPSFECGKVKAGSIGEMICRDEKLAALDRKLAEVYGAAAKKAANEHPPVLKAEQRGWIKGRNESFWEHQGEAIITWGYGTKEMRCVIKR